MLRVLAVLALLSVVFLVPQHSYAQSSQLAIFVQIKVQDSNGNLVAYLEPSRITVTNLVALNQLLDSNSPVFQKSFVTNGQLKFEVIKATDEYVHRSGTIVSQNFMSSYNGKTAQVVVLANHDGYTVVPGDKVTSYWTVIRPAS